MSAVTPLHVDERPTLQRNQLAPLILRLRGSQAQMGEQHGRLIREAGGFEPIMAYYPSMPEKLLVGLGSSLKESLMRAAVKPLMQRVIRRLERGRPKPFVERSRAMLEAAGIPPSWSRYLFVMDFLQNSVGFAGRYGLGPYVRHAGNRLAPACSTLAVWDDASADGTLRHGRNFDFPGVGVWDRAPVVVFCEPDHGVRYGFVSTRGADVPHTAFNEAGLCLSAHTRFHRDVAFDGAGIVDLCHDIARRAESLDDAVSIAGERRIASSWGIAISSGRERRSASIEANAAGVWLVEADPGESFVTTTNHYQHPDASIGEVVPSPAYAANTIGRLMTLRRLAEEAAEAGGMSLDQMKSAVGAMSDPDDPERRRVSGGAVGQPVAVATVVFEPEAQVVHVGVGPCPTWRGPWQAVEWNWTGDALEELSDPSAGPDPVVGEADDERSAHTHFIECVRVGTSTKCETDMAESLERAIELDPEALAYRLLAGGLRLRQQDLPGALAHFEAGLAADPPPFPRAQFLLWASRTATALGRRDAAEAFTAELKAMNHPLVERYQKMVGKPYAKRRFKSVAVMPLMPELM